MLVQPEKKEAVFSLFYCMLFFNDEDRTFGNINNNISVLVFKVGAFTVVLFICKLSHAF